MMLNGKMMVAVAMMVGALGAVGCNKSDSQSSTDAVAPEDSPATAPVVPDDQSKAGAEAATNWFETSARVHYWAPRAPPAVRVETYGAAPSPNHFWAPGHWHWSGRDYNWRAGNWQLRRNNYNWVGSHWANRNGRYEYIQGHWYRHW
jgi:hypothetical protein